MTHQNTRLWFVPAALIGLAAVHNLVTVQRRPAAELAIQAQSDSPIRINAYFDKGRGINERQSASGLIAANPVAEPLFFPIPTGMIRSIRLDLLGAAGAIQIKSAIVQRPRTHRPLRRFDLSQIVLENENASLVAHNAAVEVTIRQPTAVTQLTLNCTPPLAISYSANQIFTSRFVRINVFWALIGIVLFLADRWRHQWWQCLSRPFVTIDKLFLAWSERCKFSTVLPLERSALWFYAICFAVFAILATAGLHGSSIRFYGWIYGYSSVRDLPLLGTPKGTRVDEWNYHTPAILNQLLRPDRLAADSSQFGRDKAALFANIPTRHWSEWFRPQFWVFHFLPPGAAFAVYWQTKGLLLITGTFSFLLLLTRSSVAAALGALWYFFSTYTQWCYSWPSLLPEMVGIFGWVICLAAYITVGQGNWRLALAALVCTLLAIDFALCAYPPHQFPLVIFGLAIAAWWLGAHWSGIVNKQAWLTRVLALSGCCLSVALVLGLFYADVHVGFSELACTIYPGQRSVTGGNVSVAQMLSHFMDFWKSERSFPAGLGNICEATGFIWLAPTTLLLVPRIKTTHRTRLANLFLWLTFLLLVAWMLLPIPARLGKILLLDRVTPHRCLPTLGLINIAIVTIWISTRGPTQGQTLSIGWTQKVFPCLAIFILLLSALAYMNSTYNRFFSIFELCSAAGYVTFLAICLTNSWKALLAAALLLPAVATTALVNPVDRGFDVILESSLLGKIKQKPDLAKGRWLVFSEWVTLPGFFSACGLNLVNGLKIIPALDELARFDPAGKYTSVINRSCYLIAHPHSEVGQSEFESPAIGVVTWKLYPLDPKLKDIGVKYLAFDSPPPPSIQEKLKLIFKKEAEHIWAYELP